MIIEKVCIFSVKVAVAERGGVEKPLLSTLRKIFHFYGI